MTKIHDALLCCVVLFGLFLCDVPVFNSQNQMTRSKLFFVQILMTNTVFEGSSKSSKPHLDFRFITYLSLCMGLTCIEIKKEI